MEKSLEQKIMSDYLQSAEYLDSLATFSLDDVEEMMREQQEALKSENSLRTDTVALTDKPVEDTADVSDIDMLKVMSSDEMHSNCADIINRAVQGYEKITVVNLRSKIQRWQGDDYYIKNAVIKIKIINGTTEYFVVKEDMELDMLLLIDGASDTKQGFIVIKKDDGESIFELTDCYSFAISPNSTKEHELGILLSFHRELKRFHVSVLKGVPSLDAVKTLLLVGAIKGNEKRLLEGEQIDG